MFGVVIVRDMTRDNVINLLYVLIDWISKLFYFCQQLIQNTNINTVTIFSHIAE